MIDLYTWHTPNGRKVSIMLEEIGMTYNVFPINIAKDEQFQPHFLEVSPNNRIPAIVDKDNNNYSLFESVLMIIHNSSDSGISESGNLCEPSGFSSSATVKSVEPPDH